MKMLSSKQYVSEVLKSRKAEIAKENAIIVKEEKDKKKEEDEKSEYYEEMVQRTAVPVQYNKFITSVKEQFLSECIYSVFNESLNIFDKNNKKQELVKHALVKNFIEEQGVDKLLCKFRRQNILLSEFALITDKAVKSVVETTNTYNKNSWTVDSDIKDTFTNDLTNCNTGEAIATITDRVADAETEFINDNTRKKLEIDDILQSKKEKLDAMEDKPEEVKESVSAMYDAKIKSIKNSYISSIYKVIAESMTKNAITDQELRKQYIHEGNLDMKTVLEDTGILYTFLETVYTTEMADESYVREFVNNI